MREHRRRRVLLLERPRPVAGGGGGGGATEDVRPNATTSTFSSTLVGAATAHAALADNSDASYIDGTDPYGGSNGGWNGGFADLVSDGGRGIASVLLIIRGYVTPAGHNNTGSPFIWGPGTPFANGGAFAEAQGTTVGDVTYGPFTKNGGGNLTAAQFNALTLTYIPGDGDNTAARTHAITLRATYA